MCHRNYSHSIYQPIIVDYSSSSSVLNQQSHSITQQRLITINFPSVMAGGLSSNPNLQR